ncbi:MAG TPA: Rne/Rng family ribonuclease [Egibacteraceae bacterium]|nr:Rne/Rng family ribonuclease [Egibacteraceae bacterium]
MTDPTGATPRNEPTDRDDVTRTRTRTRTRGRQAEGRTEAPSPPETARAQDDQPKVVRRRRRTTVGQPERRGGTDTADAPPQEEARPPSGNRSGRRRGSRGRGRGRRGGGKLPAEPQQEETRTVAEEATEQPADQSVEEAVEAPVADEPTRLQSRGVPNQKGRPGNRGHRPAGGVSEETRRAITEGPPRRMLVHEGEERTQIAVLEERDLVEHYVTHRRDVSYVGGIYRGRVQNVLPGMEAAFVDIGKGRNGVLYAGEVNYDEADLDGELPRIEQTLRPGQTVLVQVTKDPMGTKGARLTQHLSIAGRYCVLAPGEGMLGISRKLTDDERDRLRTILKDVKPDGYGLIVRTAAEGATQEQLEDDVARLVRIWEGVEKRAATAEPLEPVYEEPNLVIRVIRDAFGPEYTDLIVDSPELCEQVRSYLADVSPELVDRVSAYSGPLFDDYEVTNQIRRALEKKVWLASGGYLIVEKTEAMWVIDVNTGKFVGKTNLEETVLRNNLEAADEIARQLRLRDMGGIIVIDFVDMLVPANRHEVLKRFKRELARDKTKSRVMEISKLGLVQMTRKNVSQGLTESFTTVCDCCEGRGAQILENIV